MSAYEAALTMYKREHDRWHQWALFFLGAIASVFIVAERTHVPLCVPSLFAFLVSLMWVGAASSIRATTDAWHDTLLELERSPSPEAKVFHIFDAKVKAFDYRADFMKTLQVWRGETFRSVTRLLVLFGLVAALVFLVITVVNAHGLVEARRCHSPARLTTVSGLLPQGGVSGSSEARGSDCSRIFGL